MKERHIIDGKMARGQEGKTEVTLMFVRWTHPDDNEAQILNGRAQGTKH
jgi:hypothetical protein